MTLPNKVISSHMVMVRAKYLGGGSALNLDGSFRLRDLRGPGVVYGQCV